MTHSLGHRGPDADGHYLDGPVALGHRRLSIIDLSPAGNQPFFSSNGRYSMVFNGELYNFQEVRQQLSNHTFKSTGDTEVLLEGWATWGEAVLPKLKGMFSFAIWDKQDRELILCRDRLGVKPLYYYRDEQRFIFASEIRGILAAGNIPKTINQQALAGYLSFQSVTGNQTIIDGIKELKAGCLLRIKDKELTQKQYWSLYEPTTSYNGEGIDTIKKTIRSLLARAIEQRLVSDVPVGAFLSGGIDSSAVVGLMAEVSSARPQTFNVCFQEEAFDESAYAELIAKKFNAQHHKILLQPQSMLDNLLPALNAMDTPSGDGINSYVVSKAIRDAGITVALSGVGGDELFAGYPFFNQYLQLRKRKALWPFSAPFRQLGASFLPNNNSRNERIKAILQANSCNIDSFYPVFRQILPPTRLARLTRLPAFANQLFQYAPAMANFPDYSQVSIAEYLGYTQYTLLKDMDQMSMAVSLEVREPFFDHELIEYVLQVPDKYKHPLYPKKLLVDALDGLLPDEIVHRKKQGFVFPWAVWMKNELKEFCSGKIEAMGARSFINENALNAEWLKFQKGDPAVRWMELWLFIVLEHWLQKNGIE